MRWGIVLGVALLSASAWAGPMADKVKARGVLNCGVNTGLAGFAERGANGVWTGFDADLCRGLAAAVLGDPAKVNFVPLTAAQRFDAITQGRVDVLFRNTTHTFTFDAQPGVDFGPVYLYDGQGFLVRTGDQPIERADALNGKTVCVQQGTTSETSLGEWAKRRRLAITVERTPDAATALRHLLAGRCAAFTADRTALAASRARLGQAEGGKLRLLDTVIGREPLAPALPAGDPSWRDLVTWYVYALILAEDEDITAGNVANSKTRPDPEVRRLLGAAPGLGRGVGLDDDWAYRAIAAVGNYGQLFQRHLGGGSPLQLDRGQNRPWHDGGLLYAPPFR